MAKPLAMPAALVSVPKLPELVGPTIALATANHQPIYLVAKPVNLIQNAVILVLPEQQQFAAMGSAKPGIVLLDKRPPELTVLAASETDNVAKLVDQTWGFVLEQTVMEQCVSLQPVLFVANKATQADDPIVSE